MNILNFKRLFFLIPLILCSCISMVPENVVTQLDRDFEGGSENCKAMFMAMPVDCKENPSYCIDYQFNKNIVSYQDAAQTTIASFAVAKTEDNKIAVCSWARHGSLRGWSSLDKYALASCERMRLTDMSKRQISLKACEIYAHGNDIL